MNASIRTTLLTAMTVLLALCGLEVAARQSGELRVTPGEIRWPSGQSSLVGTSFASGIESVILEGNPAEGGLYTMLLRVGPDTRIDAHSHPDDRVATVMSGTWYFGYGEAFDETLLKELPSGSIYTEPPGSNHFAATRDEGVVIQITGFGPSGTTYVDLATDPSR